MLGEPVVLYRQWPRRPAGADLGTEPGVDSGDLLRCQSRVQRHGNPGRHGKRPTPDGRRPGVDEGYAVLLTDPRSGIVIGLHHDEANPGQPFTRAGPAWTTSHSASLTAPAWTHGQPGSANSASSTPASSTPTSRCPTRCSSSGIPTTSSSSSSTWPADAQRAPRPPHGEAERRPDATLRPRPRPSPLNACECTHMLRVGCVADLATAGVYACLSAIGPRPRPGSNHQWLGLA
jgi:hypothetical protein